MNGLDQLLIGELTEALRKLNIHLDPAYGGQIANGFCDGGYLERIASSLERIEAKLNLWENKNK